MEKGERLELQRSRSVAAYASRWRSSKSVPAGDAANTMLMTLRRGIICDGDARQPRGGVEFFGLG